MDKIISLSATAWKNACILLSSVFSILKLTSSSKSYRYSSYGQANYITITGVVILSFMIFTSCADKSRYVYHDFDLRDYENKMFVGKDVGTDLAFNEMNKALAPNYVVEEKPRAEKQMKYVRKIERKMKSNPSKKGKYEFLLQQKKDTLQKDFDVRVAEKMKFLQDFYSSLFQLSNKDFTAKYKRHCSFELLKELKYIYEDLHLEYGYAWSLFTNNKIANHDFRIDYLDGNPAEVGNNALAQYMFGDSVKHQPVSYHFTNMEDKWFKVETGTQNIMVQVDGQKDYITITGLVNPNQKFAIKNMVRNRRFLGRN